MRTKSVPSSWLGREGRRLDSGPYLSGAMEAKLLLERISLLKEPLRRLTTGYDGGIYNGPQFSRIWVESPDHGVPFLGSSSMLRADLTNLPLLRKKDAFSPKLRHLRLEHGTTLISCSGTVGRMVYTRPDMEGMWSSQDIMKVVPDPKKIPPGYLYAFLSSKFGVPMVVSGTYGAIIQHIEPEHIADLPVPRLGAAVEQRASDLVSRAANGRTRAAELLARANEEFMKLLVSKPTSPDAQTRNWTAVSSQRLQARLDAYYFSDPCAWAREVFDAASDCMTRRLDEVADVFIPGIFKRIYADDPNYGVPYLTGADVFQINPETDRYLTLKVANENRLVVDEGAILIQEAGQLGGLIGRSVLVGRVVRGSAVSNNMIRVRSRDEEDLGYLFALLASEPGVRLIGREAAGSSIPHLDATRVGQVPIPWAESRVRMMMGGGVMEAQRLRDDACDFEAQARALVEHTIEEAV